MQPHVSREMLEASLPRIEGEITVTGCEKPVTILRDAWGIPHIRAHTPADAFFGQGYAAASDRFFQMDTDRMKAMGRWAEMIGRDALDSDILMRKMGLARAAQEHFLGLRPGTRGMIRAYTAGINAYLDQTTQLPVEYALMEWTPETWEPWHCLAVFLVRHVAMSSRDMKVFRARLVNHLGPEKAAALFPGYPEDHPLILPPGAPYSPEPVDRALRTFQEEADNIRWLGDGAQGSNNWLIGGTRTDCGKPLMAGDPHRMLEIPNVYWQNHLRAPEMEVIGFSFPGVPGFPHFGHNDRVAWCITHTGADNQDLFLERFFGGRYLYRGEWLDPQTRWERIHVRGEENVEFEVAETRNGPVISGDTEDGYGLSFRWSAICEQNTTMDCFVPMMAAQDADDLEMAVRNWVDPCNNLLFADIDGEFGYRVRGKLPVRSSRAGWIPLAGWSGDGNWNGYVSFDEMPSARHPEGHVFATANNRVAGDEYPHYIATDFTPGYRAMRLFERLDGNRRFTIGDMPSIHADILSVAARELCPLLEALRVDPDDEPLRWAQQLLLEWDHRMRPGDIAPTVYSTFREILVDEVLDSLLGKDRHDLLDGPTGARIRQNLRAPIVRAIRKDDRRLLRENTDWPTLMTRAMQRTLRVLKTELGTQEKEWRWGRVHRARAEHPLTGAGVCNSHLLNPSEIPMGGDADTIQAAAYLPGEGFSVVSTAVGRYAFDLSDWNRSGWVLPLGNSGHPGSRHYTDQKESWTEHRLIPMLYDWEEIEGGTEGILTLKPSQ